METPFDWLALTVFVGLVVLLLQRSSQENPPDKLWHYGPPAIGCAVVNYIGNEGHTIAAAIGLIAVLVYIYYVLRPQVSL
ncbi:MAG: XrtV sorting system accessory protein [Sphingomonas sp.]